MNTKEVLKGSVQFSCSVMSDSLQPRWLQHARLPCLSPTPRAYSNSCPLSQWCHPTILSSVVPFSSTFSLSQHQGLFWRVSSSHQVAKALELQLQHRSFQWTCRTECLKCSSLFIWTMCTSPGFTCGVPASRCLHLMSWRWSWPAMSYFAIIPALLASCSLWRLYN